MMEDDIYIYIYIYIPGESALQRGMFNLSPERDWIAKARNADKGFNLEMFIPIIGAPWQMTGIWRSSGIADAAANVIKQQMWKVLVHPAVCGMHQPTI